MSAAILCLFARAPVAGRVKRRLAADIGADEALRAHRLLVEDTVARLAVVPGVITELWLTGDPGAPAGEEWSRGGTLRLRCQRGDDLGARMLHALMDGLERADEALVAGTDVPAVDAAYVTAAVAALATHDVVFGPAEDGGYGLVGARRQARRGLARLFEDVPWGSDRVLDITLTRARESGLSVALLEPVWDVDTVDDWRRYLRERGAP